MRNDGHLQTEMQCTHSILAGSLALSLPLLPLSPPLSLSDSFPPSLPPPPFSLPPPHPIHPLSAATFLQGLGFLSGRGFQLITKGTDGIFPLQRVPQQLPGQEGRNIESGRHVFDTVSSHEMTA